MNFHIRSAKQIKFGALDQELLDCGPLRELRELIEAGKCPRLVAAWGVRAGGDCALVMAALWGDLGLVPNLNHRWDWISGECAIGPHYWAVAEDFAFDASNGATRGVLVARQEKMIALRSATNLRLRASVFPSPLSSS